MFFPGIAALFINPFYFARKGLALHIKKLARHIKGKTIDIGCGLKPYQGFCHSTEYIGLEIDTAENREKKMADYYYDGLRIPFDDAVFDSAVASQVFEHVFNPDDFFSEVHRVLKPGGMMLLTAPFIWNEHEQPLDYARYSSFGLTSLIEKHGFEIVEFRKSINDVRVIFQIINIYIYIHTSFHNKLIKYFLRIFLILPSNLLGELLVKVTPKNLDLYLDNIVLAKKPNPDE